MGFFFCGLKCFWALKQEKWVNTIFAQRVGKIKGAER